MHTQLSRISYFWMPDSREVIDLVDIDVIEKDGFFDIFYALNDPGDYDVNVKFGGKDIPNGSFSIKVA